MKPSFIAIGCDHAGFTYKELLKKSIQDMGIEVKDMGTHSEDSVDYPDFVHPVADALKGNEDALGVLVCGSANGVAITANKHMHIRAAIAWQREIAELARKHNNANVVCIPARFISEETALDSLDGFLTAEFEGGRHQGRVDKMTSFC
jgi:ribose 5-phosphate isomerase B